MRRFLAITATLIFALALPLGALAMDHGGGTMAGHDHSKMEGMNHGDQSGMAMAGGMIMLGEKTVDGVRAMVHLKDVKAAMAKMGMSETHHFMVMFVDVASGKPIEAGTVAVKIKHGTAEAGPPVQLMGMQGHFGADITLSDPGKYEFTLGTKLPDGKSRKFDFEFDNK